jgi:hypothetical protein
VLEVRRIDQDGVQTIQPGVIGISRVQSYIALVSYNRPKTEPDGGVRFQLAGHGDSGGSQMIRQGYHFWLDDPAYTRPPTLEEIRAVLGEAATLDVAVP